MNNLTGKILFAALLVQSLSLISQEKRYTYYSNGERRFEVEDSMDCLLVKEYYPSGPLKDSYTLKNDTLIGKRSQYYKNGKIKYFFKYSHRPIASYVRVKKFRNDGTLVGSGAYIKNRRFGVLKKYNKKGEVIYYSDWHKNRVVSVPKAYRKGRHLSDSSYFKNIRYSKALLLKGEEEVKLKSGAIVALQINGEKKSHIQLDGFSEDSIYVSAFEYDMSGNKKTLRYMESFALNTKEIDTLFFSRNRVGAAEFAVNQLLLASTLFLFEPPLILLLSGLPPNFAVGAFMLSSVPMYVWYRHLRKKLNPLGYSMDAWHLEPVE